MQLLNSAWLKFWKDISQIQREQTEREPAQVRPGIAGQ